jgi:hydroxyacylglutathione hydrolase
VYPGYVEFEQFYLGCLAQASYLIGSRGEAAIVDPRRDVDDYLTEAETRGLRIKYVIETHLHADFVSGHRELAERTGAEIVFGARAGATFPHRAVTDGEELRVGDARLRILETPGHTPESISILVFDKAQDRVPKLVLTGDTLFIGDVGRPDLVGKQGFTPEQMAALLYDSLHQKLLTLPDDVRVYPAHGAGSLCGKNISKETSSTIGEQRKTNYALQPMPRDAFIKMLTADQPEVPRYFPMDVDMNRSGARPLVRHVEPKALSPREAKAGTDAGALLLDVREASGYGACHALSSLNVALNGQFASWCGTLIAAEQKLVILADDPRKAEEAALRLARVGLENVLGYVLGGIAAWSEAGLPCGSTPQIDVAELRARLDAGEPVRVLDVRRSGEHVGGHVPGAASIPLDRLEGEIARLPRTGPLAVICAGGYRSSAAASLLERAGVSEIVNVVGGTNAWIAAGYPIERPAH